MFIGRVPRMISVRLSPSLLRAVLEVARVRGERRSETIRRLLAEALASHGVRLAAHEVETRYGHSAGGRGPI